LVTVIKLVLTLESQHTGTKTPFSQVMGEERMRLGYWFGSVLCVSLSQVQLRVLWDPRDQLWPSSCWSPQLLAVVNCKKNEVL